MCRAAIGIRHDVFAPISSSGVLAIVAFPHGRASDTRSHRPIPAELPVWGPRVALLPVSRSSYRIIPAPLPKSPLKNLQDAPNLTRAFWHRDCHSQASISRKQ